MDKLSCGLLTKVTVIKSHMFDVGPKQLLEIAGHKFSDNYRNQLKNYRYGMGVFKMDFVLKEPVPFTSEICRNAGTIHLGNSMAEIVASEQAVWEGKQPEKP